MLVRILPLGRWWTVMGTWPCGAVCAAQAATVEIAVWRWRLMRKEAWEAAAL